MILYRLFYRCFSNRKVLVIPFLLLQSCSREPLGRELSSNFELPTETSVEEKVLKTENKQESVEDSNIIKEKNKSQDINPTPQGKSRKPLLESVLKKNIDNQVPSFDGSLKINEEVEVLKPQSYRIILKLFKVNPSAPGEDVTRILRKSGIQFEVEKIESFRFELDNQGLPEKR